MALGRQQGPRQLQMMSLSQANNDDSMMGQADDDGPSRWQMMGQRQWQAYHNDGPPADYDHEILAESLGVSTADLPPIIDSVEPINELETF